MSSSLVMGLGEGVRKWTGIGGERPFRDISGKEGAESRERPGRLPTVVAIHGFTGVPSEVGLCSEVAEELGLASVAPLLAGHGRDARHLRATTYADWLESARVSFDAARKKGPVILVGLSMGSLIATELTLGAPGDVAGLVLLSNAFWLTSPHPRLSLTAARLLRFPNFYIDKKGSNIGDLDGRREHLSLDAQPLYSALSLLEAGARLREELFRIHRPTLILHGANDGVCPVENAWKVAERLGTRDFRVVVLPRSQHIITRDVEKQQVRDELRRFFQRVGRLPEHPPQF